MYLTLYLRNSIFAEQCLNLGGDDNDNMYFKISGN